MPDFSDRLRSILEAENLTVYGAALIIGADTDQPIKVIHERLSRWLVRSPNTWVLIESALDSLGYEIEIKKKSDDVSRGKVSSQD